MNVSPALEKDLLEPSLAHRGARGASIYSTRTGFFSSFFGGAIGGAVVTAVNAHRLGRLSRDAWLVMLGFAVEATLLWWLVRLEGLEWLQAATGRSGPRVVGRAVGLAYFGLSFWMHRTYYRNMAFAGVTPPSGWRLGFAAILVGGAVSVGLALLMSV